MAANEKFTDHSIIIILFDFRADKYQTPYLGFNILFVLMSHFRSSGRVKDFYMDWFSEHYLSGQLGLVGSDTCKLFEFGPYLCVFKLTCVCHTCSDGAVKNRQSCFKTCIF